MSKKSSTANYGARGRHKKFNRSLHLSAKDVLDLVRFSSGAGHPHDVIPAGATIETRKAGRGFRYVVRWHGIPTDVATYEGGHKPPALKARKPHQVSPSFDVAA
jgi:hypothetical protein